MQYQLKDVITTNATFTANQDGTLTAIGVVAVVEIVGAYAGKFLQKDIMPNFIIPADETSQNQPGYIELQASEYVEETYPNT